MLSKLIYWLQKRKFGVVLNASREWGKIPHLFFPFSLFYAMVDRNGSPLDPELRKLAMGLAARLNDCHFCIDLNRALYLEENGTPAKLELVREWKTSEVFSETEKLVLEYTERMTSLGKPITPELRQKLKAKFSEQEVLELTAANAFQNLSAKFNNALGVPEQGLYASVQGPKGRGA